MSLPGPIELLLYDLHIPFVDFFLELLDLIEMLFQVHSLLLDDRHLAIVSQDALAGELCIRDLADELPFFQSFEQEGFLEVPGFVFEPESFWLVSSSSGNLSSPSNS